MKRPVLLLYFILFCAKLYAYNLHQISYKEGLSNSAVLELFQDHEGYMWFCTCDGLNKYDGLNIYTYQLNSKNQRNLSSSLIASVLETEDNILWVETNYGLNKFDKKRQTVEYYNQFKGSFKVVKNKDNQLFVLSNDSKLFYYNKSISNFEEIKIAGISYNNLLDFFIDENNIIWIFQDNHKVLSFNLSFEEEKPVITGINKLDYNRKILYAFNETNKVYFINDLFELFEYDTETTGMNYIKNVSEEIKKYGEVSAIIKDNNDYLTGFKTNGLIRLKYNPMNEIKYETEQIDIYCGVFSLLKDKYRNIIWIGTDGQGVYKYSNDVYSFKSFLSDNMAVKINKPIRSLLVDKENNLWIGTKGDGLLKFTDFNIDGEYRNKDVAQYKKTNSSLVNDNIYAFSESRRNVLWIGGDGPGLNYYSYKDKMVHSVNAEYIKDIQYIHGICELNDSTLWVSTVGLGVLKITIGGNTNYPVIKEVKKYSFSDHDITKNYFFSVYRQNDSIIWFGNRGYGAFLLNVHTEEFEIYNLGTPDIEANNDVLCFYKDKDNAMWFGTGFGLYGNRLTSQNEPYLSFCNFPNNTIHGILNDSKNNLWLSTNKGIIEFNPEHSTFKTYINDIDIVEFSDGAYFKDERTGTMLFGGINGFVTLKENVNITNNEYFNPPILFDHLRIFDENVNLIDHLKEIDDKQVLILKNDQRFFSLSFIALDYMNGPNYTYQYQLENLNDQWINNGNSNIVTITNIPPGEYNLNVKYNNGFRDNENIYSLRIKILPPWYQTTGAYIIYSILLILTLFIIIKLYIKKQSKRKAALLAKLYQEQKEEVYESKLRFFINITHDLCTPLTLINGPCQRILEYSKSDEFIKKYTTLIRRNAERLNGLIQDLIEFRRIDTGNKKLEITKVDVSGVGKEITGSFDELAETKNITYKVNISEPVEWQTDRDGFITILTNLISNAFKYTPDNGEIKIDIYINEKQKLEVDIINTGKGIKQEDIPFIFDRYSVLENIEKQSGKGISPRNGLGLAICSNMVKLLNGELTVNSDPNEYTEFKVILPLMEVTKKDEDKEPVIITPERSVKVGEQLLMLPRNDHKEGRPTVLIIDDDMELLWFMSDILSDKYNIIPVNDPSIGMETLQKIRPDLIISDVMMDNINGIELTKEIKSNKTTNHIPVILLSAKQDVEDQIKGIESGAELYITKPFNVDYFKIVVDKLFGRENELKDYLNSVISSFELTDGKFIHKDEKLFFKKLITIIDENLTNPDLSPDLLARSLGVSIRHLYRKSKDIGGKTPADIIKEYRLSMAEHLLIKTNLSIDEIIDKSGFINKGTFFKLFQNKYGQTPKNYRKLKIEEADIKNK